MPISIERRKLSLPQVARMLGVADGKVLAWIKSGELRAINLSRLRGQRPRYAIDIADLERFEQSRTIVPETAPPTRRVRRKATAGVKEFF